MAISKKMSERIAAGMKKMVPIVHQLSSRDVSEADTVALVKDMLCDVFGYDKYADVTGQYAIRGTFCDLAIISADKKVLELIEIKAIGITLNDRHVKQAVDYAANLGSEWVILTNAQIWRLYRVIFSKPLDKQLVAEIDVTKCDANKEDDLDLLYLFTKEGFKRGAPSELHDKQEATSRFLLATVILNNKDVLRIVRRELRRVVDVSVSEEDIQKVIAQEVIKRDVLEGPQAEEAAARVRKAQSRTLRQEPKPSVQNHSPVAGGPAPVGGAPLQA